MFCVCSFVASKWFKILSGWNRNRKKIGFAYVLAKSPISRLKSTSIKRIKSD